MDLHLAGKVALITGGSRGIGRAIAQRLAEEGCDVGICGRTEETLTATRDALAAHGGRVHTVVADVMQPGEAERFVEETAQALGGIDMAVANVGGATAWRFADSRPEDWVQTFEMNVFHAVRLITASVPHMRERGGGSAAIISSISGWKPAAGGPYGAAKAAEIFLAGQLAWDLAADRIRVNTVSPGSIMFPGGGWDRRRTNDAERFGAFERDEFPWGRLGSAEEIADVVAFVLSDRASWINGANIPVDGAQGEPSLSG
jgi:3-oxoacyl-[acyl-carrier protein] reductase